MQVFFESCKFNTPEKGTMMPCELKTQYKQVFVFIGLWFGLIATLVTKGIFDITGDSLPLPMLVATWEPPVYLFFSLWFSQKKRDWLAKINLNILIIPHAARWVGMGFIVLSMHKLVPVEFAYPAGIGDVMAAIGAMYIVGAAAVGVKTSKSKISAWNYWGIIDFIIALSLGISTRHDSWLQPNEGINSSLMGQFPLGMIPCFFVPMFLCLHVLTWFRLRQL